MALTFSEVVTPSASGWSPKDVCWASGFGLFIFCGSRTTGADRILTTPDCSNFTYRTSPSASFWNGVAYSPSLNRAVIVGSGVAGWSDNGTSWSAATLLPEANTWSSVCWSEWLDLFIAVSSTGTNRVMTSADGKSWTAVAAAAALAWGAVIASPGAVVALAVEASTPSTQLMMRATDGAAASWSLVTTGTAYLTGNDHNNSGSSGIAYSDDLDMLCTTVRTSTDRMMITSVDDGATWAEQTIPTPTDGKQVWGVLWIGEQFFASRMSNFKYLSAPDGVTWSQTSVSAANSNYNAFAWSPTLRKFISHERTGSFRALVGDAPAPPTVTRVIASQGRTIGGRLVRIIGSGFTGTPGVVTFGGSVATDVTVVSNTLITARTPAHAAGLVDVVVDGGTLDDGYRYTDSVFGNLTIRQEQGIRIEDTLNDAPNSCAVRCDRVGSPESPRLGEGVRIVDPASGAVLFGGTAVITRDGIDGKPSNPGYRDLDAGDLTWRLNAIRPFGRWDSNGSPPGVPANLVAQDLIDTFAPQFSLVAQSGLPYITLTCDRSQTLSEVFSTIATLIGGSWFPDDEFGVHLFVTDPDVDDTPDPITDDTPLYDPPPTVTRDLTQIRNRVYVSGAGGATSYEPPVSPISLSPTDSVTATTGGSIPDGAYDYYITFTTENGETAPTRLTSYFPAGGFIIAGADSAFQLTNLDDVVHSDTRVTGRRIWRNRTGSPTNDLRGLYLVTSLGNTSGIGENDFLDGLADSDLTVRAPRTDTSATIFVMVENVVAQTYLAGLLNTDGGDDDGVREGYVLDESLTTLEQATARGQAELTLFAYPITTVLYACRDEKSHSGRTVSISLTNPEVSGLFKIQKVAIDQIAIDAAGLLFPRFTVTASSVRFSLDDLFRNVSLDGRGTGGSGGGSSSASGGSTSSGGGGASPTPEDLTAQINGSPDTVFTTSSGFSVIAVYKNGLRMRQGDDYTITGSDEFTMTIAPVSGDSLVVEYR